MTKLDKEQIYHLIDLLQIDIDLYESNDSSKRLLSDSQKFEGIKYNECTIKDLALMLRELEDEDKS
jgi:hypothetical protein